MLSTLHLDYWQFLIISIRDTKEVDKEDWDLENVVEPSSVEINKTTVIAMNIEESGEKAKKMNKSEMLNVVLGLYWFLFIHVTLNLFLCIYIKSSAAFLHTFW